jgi:hypothetical protein
MSCVPAQGPIAGALFSLCDGLVASGAAYGPGTTSRYIAYECLTLMRWRCGQSATGWSPVYVEDNLGVMSIGFMLQNPDDAVIWRGPRKNGRPDTRWCREAAHGPTN